jgi:hypothetical protein
MKQGIALEGQPGGKQARALHGDILLAFGLEQHTIGSQNCLQVSRLNLQKILNKVGQERLLQDPGQTLTSIGASARHSRITMTWHAWMGCRLSFPEPARPSV